MAPRWHKVIRDLTSHKIRTALVVLSIAVGVFAIAVVLGGREVLLSEFDVDFEASIPPSAELDTTGFDVALADKVAEREDVRAAEGRRRVTVRYTPDSVDAQASTAGWETLRLWAIPEFGRGGVKKLVREEYASWPPRPDGVILEKSALQVAGLLGGRHDHGRGVQRDEDRAARGRVRARHQLRTGAVPRRSDRVRLDGDARQTRRTGGAEPPGAAAGTHGLSLGGQPHRGRCPRCRPARRRRAHLAHRSARAGKPLPGRHLQGRLSAAARTGHHGTGTVRFSRGDHRAGDHVAAGAPDRHHEGGGRATYPDLVDVPRAGRRLRRPRGRRRVAGGPVGELEVHRLCSRRAELPARQRHAPVVGHSLGARRRRARADRRRRVPGQPRSAPVGGARARCGRTGRALRTRARRPRVGHDPRAAAAGRPVIAQHLRTQGSARADAHHAGARLSGGNGGHDGSHVDAADRRGHGFVVALRRAGIHGAAAARVQSWSARRRASAV